MKTTQQLHGLGQSLWLDNMTHELLIDGTLQRYVAEFSVTGLTSNPTIFFPLQSPTVHHRGFSWRRSKPQAVW